LSQNILRLRLPAHARVGDGEAAAREMGRLLGFGVQRDRFREVVFLPIGGGKIRIQIKVIWIELQRPLTLTNCLVNLVVSEVSGEWFYVNVGQEIPDLRDPSPGPRKCRIFLYGALKETERPAQIILAALV